MFEKFGDVIGRKPVGRPVGVRDGMGSTPPPQQVFNPLLKGMAHTPNALPAAGQPAVRPQGQYIRPPWLGPLFGS